MSAGKSSYPALLGGGLHTMTMQEVRALCVAAFPTSSTRPKIYSGIVQLLSDLTALEVVREIWLDGSFMSKKTDPDDCDLVVLIDGNMLENATPSVQASVVTIAGKANRSATKAKYLCDCMSAFWFPLVHAQHAYGENLQAYWKKYFGTCRSGRQRGLAKVAL